jgi:hypothetical protein
MYCFRLIYHIILFKDRFYKYGLWVLTPFCAK